MLFLVASVSAFEFDNIKDRISFTKGQNLTIGEKQLEYNPLWEKYNPIRITNAFGLGKNLFEGV